MSAPARAAVGGPGQAAGAGASPALAGDLAHFAPAEVLQLLQLAQASGRLELTRARPAEPGRAAAETVEVFFEAGRPLFVRTSGATVRTGEILIHRGHAGRAAVDQALEEQRRAPGRRLGRILRDAGAATPGAVSQAVHEGMRRILYGMLLWHEGRFDFVPGERVPDNDLPLDLDLDRLILEGLRLADQAQPR